MGVKFSKPEIDLEQMRTGKNQVVKAHVPMSEFLSYAPDLRSMTGGRGTFTMEFSHYAEVPRELLDEILYKIKGYVTNIK